MAIQMVKIYHPELGEAEVVVSSLKVWTERGWSTENVDLSPVSELEQDIKLDDESEE